MNTPLQIALRLARHPVNDLERVELGQQILPHLRHGENVDAGALRILADRVESLERVALVSTNTGRDNRFFFQCWMEGGNQFPMNTNEGAAPEQPQLLDFGAALRALKEGKRVTRQGWNGKGMFLFLLPGGSVPKTAIHDPSLRAVIDAEVEGDAFEALPSIRMWTTNSSGRRAVLTGWLASQTDMLSEDWVVLEAFQEDRSTPWLSFNQFLDFGSNGRPDGERLWSFDFHGHPVTHETDACYVVGSVKFRSGEFIRINSAGKVEVSEF